MSQHDSEYDQLVGRALQAAADQAEPAADGLDRIRARLETPYPRPVAWMLTRFPVAASFVLARLLSVVTWPQVLLGAAGGRLRVPWAPGPPAGPGQAKIVLPFEDLPGWPFGEQAEEISSGKVPPPWLPGGSWRSPAPGGANRTGRRQAARWPRWVAPAACAALVAGVAAVPMALSNVMHRSPPRSWPEQAVTPASQNAAAWVATQVSRSALVACDPAMCLALTDRGLPRGQLRQLRLTGAYPRYSTVVVATPAVRTEFGRRLAFYAPAVIASFGSGSAQIDVRVTAPAGPAAYWSALRADQRNRKEAGHELLGSARIAASVTAKRELLAGRVDAALLVAITDLAGDEPVYMVAFGDSGPGQGAGGPLRSVELAENGRAAGMSSAAYVRAMIGQLDAEHPPYLPAHIETLVRPGGERVLWAQFGAPSPLGLPGFGSITG